MSKSAVLKFISSVAGGLVTGIAILLVYDWIKRKRNERNTVDEILAEQTQGE